MRWLLVSLAVAAALYIAGVYAMSARVDAEP